MLGWYRAQVREHGLFEATGLLWGVALSRTTASGFNKILRFATMATMGVTDGP